MAEFTFDEYLDQGIDGFYSRIALILNSLSQEDLASLEPMQKNRVLKDFTSNLDTLVRLRELMKGRPDSRPEHVLPETIVQAIQNHLKGNGHGGS